MEDCCSAKYVLQSVFCVVECVLLYVAVCCSVVHCQRLRCSGLLQCQVSVVMCVALCYCFNSCCFDVASRRMGVRL